MGQQQTDIIITLLTLAILQHLLQTTFTFVQNQVREDVRLRAPSLHKIHTCFNSLKAKSMLFEDILLSVVDFVKALGELLILLSLVCESKGFLGVISLKA